MDLDARISPDIPDKSALPSNSDKQAFVYRLDQTDSQGPMDASHSSPDHKGHTESDSVTVCQWR